jgi:hypothetical protein
MANDAEGELEITLTALCHRNACDEAARYWSASALNNGTGTTILNLVTGRGVCRHPDRDDDRDDLTQPSDSAAKYFWPVLQ